jgi:hypothetical protein
MIRFCNRHFFAFSSLGITTTHIAVWNRKLIKTNLSIRASSQENLKLSMLLPSFKNKGERSDPSNNRPIAQTFAVAKIIEKCFANQMDKYFTDNNLYSPNQHGFRRGKAQ